jgi:glycosyltransferase involved in cell wall biosynthesis
VAAEIVEVLSDESDFMCIEETYLRFYDLDLSEFDGIVSSKAPSYVARHPNHVCYLLHTMRVFYDMFDYTFPQPGPELRGQRRTVHALDTAAFERPQIQRLFAIGEEVAARLRNFNGIDASVMHHPTSLVGLHEGAFDYFFLPGRLHPWKRVDLAIEAMRSITEPINLLISGTGEDEDRLRQLASGDPRIRFVGRVTDAELVQLYADCIAVLFVPRSEDLGLVTLEAYGSSKPVITCADSGEPARLVRDDWSGFVCQPRPRDIARRMERFAVNQNLAKTMGRNGHASVSDITWRRVAKTLVAALGFDALSKAQSPDT